MADTKISALTAAGSALGADELAANEAGTSKKVTLTQVKTFVNAVAAPTFVAASAEFSSTGVPTAILPTGHTTNDILVLVLQSSNENLATPAGYTAIPPQNGIGVAVTAGSVRLGLFWKRDGGSESAPTIADSGDHTYGMMFAIRGCPTVGDPFHFLDNFWKRTSSTAFVGPKGNTAIDNCLVVDIIAHAVDNAGAQAGAATNASLTSLTEKFDDATTDGTGGGIVVISGTMALSGPVASTTFTWSNTTVDLSTRLAFVSSDTITIASTSRSSEARSYIGSPPDLDDIWVKPSGASRVFAQVCDGGGGGSGGNTTTTAAGGGGGGGGGYDEAWYDPDDLGATVTVHAGKGGAAGTGLLQAGNIGVLSEFDKGNRGPLTSSARIAGAAATAAGSADGGNGGSGSGMGRLSPVVLTSRVADVTSTTPNTALGGVGGSGGSGTTAPVGGNPATWGGGGGESGGDTDAGITVANNGYSLRGGGGGSSGRTNTNISGSGAGGGADGVISAQGTAGGNSVRAPYGGSGGVGGGSSVVTGGPGGFPGGGGGGGAGVAGGFGGAGGDGVVLVTTFF